MQDLLLGRVRSSPLLSRNTWMEDLGRLAGGPSRDDMEAALEEGDPPPLKRSGEEEEERRGRLEAEKKPSLALCLKSSVWMSWLSRVMGEPLDSEYSTPKWRRWARAWLDRPLRVSNQAPHSWQMMSLLGSPSRAAKERKHSTSLHGYLT